MVKKFLRPRDVAEALSMLSSEPGAMALAGGTELLARGGGPDCAVVSIAGLLPAHIKKSGARLEIGANATFQDLVDSRETPDVLRAAALGMVNRNIRNRATLGGNLAQARPSSSLAPLFLAAEAEVELARGGRLGLESWMSGGPRKELATLFHVSFDPESLYAYERWSRSACDLAIVSAALRFVRQSDGLVRGLRIALGGAAAMPELRPDLAALIEGKPLPPRDELEAALGPRIGARGDLRGSAAFKNREAAILIAAAFASAMEGGGQSRGRGEASHSAAAKSAALADCSRGRGERSRA